ncbi:homoserine dehydrogenase [Micrococcoides hystricis]|uniref:Homoserine dehydrogenase n=1 Tax=Micrococcoides hystricis TaxID=1572761 RepID=A0ABV6PD66_9MICC
MTDVKQLKVALLGAGTVGAQVARILLEDTTELTRRVGAELTLTGIAVRNLDSQRDADLPAELFTTDANALITDADVVIELIGGIVPASEYIRTALSSGAAVITGNKALIAQQGAELHALAAENNTVLAYEAAVAGAIPILRPISDSLGGDNITKVMGIVNGTTNFILDKMDTTGAAFDDVLAEAQALGYAEADPTADVEGHDAAAKAAILASLAFHGNFTFDEVHCEGITKISAADIAAAAQENQVIKLLAIVAKSDAGVSMRVHPTLISRDHPLAAVRGAYNAVFVEAENAGDLMFYGQGAGGNPTASAVMGDLVTTARALVAGALTAPVEANELPALALDDVQTSYAVTMRVADQSGVLAQISSLFAENNVSIEAMRQTAMDEAEAAGVQANGDKAEAWLRIVTHVGREADLAATVEKIRELAVVKEITSVLRVEGN